MLSPGFDIHPDSMLVTAIEHDPNEPETRRVYLGHRSLGLHTHVKDPEAIRQLEAAWANNRGHLTTRVPRTAWCTCDTTFAQRVAIEERKG